MLGICDKACNSSSKYGIRSAIESTNEDKNEFKVSDFWLAFLQSVYDSCSRRKGSFVQVSRRRRRDSGMPASSSAGEELASSSQHCAQCVALTLRRLSGLNSPPSSAQGA